jgi:hypothetical protein
MGYMPIYHREVAAPIAKKDDVSYSYLMDGQLAYAKKKGASVYQSRPGKASVAPRIDATISSCGYRRFMKR